MKLSFQAGLTTFIHGILDYPFSKPYVASLLCVAFNPKLDDSIVIFYRIGLGETHILVENGWK